MHPVELFSQFLAFGEALVTSAVGLIGLATTLAAIIPERMVRRTIKWRMSPAVRVFVVILVWTAAAFWAWKQQNDQLRVYTGSPGIYMRHEEMYWQAPNDRNPWIIRYGAECVSDDILTVFLEYTMFVNENNWQRPTRIALQKLPPCHKGKRIELVVAERFKIPQTADGATSRFGIRWSEGEKNFSDGRYNYMLSFNYKTKVVIVADGKDEEQYYYFKVIRYRDENPNQAPVVLTDGTLRSLLNWRTNFPDARADY